MIKVIQFLPSLNDGGAETLVKDYAILMKKDGFETIVLTIYSNKNNANYRILKNAGIRIISIFSDWGLKNKIINKIVKRKYIQFVLKRIIKKEKPTAIHVHMWLLRYLVGLKNELLNIKLFYTCHSLPSRYFTGNLDGELTAAKWLIKNSNITFIALHENMKEELDKLLGISSTVIIRNGIDFSRFTKIGISKEEKRKSINIPKNAYVVGHIGRYTKAKNQVFLINVFSKILKYKKNAHLLLIGAGEMETQIRNEVISHGIIDKVTMLSQRSDIPELLNSMDVFVFPSLYEGLGIALIEAQVCNIPCIVSDAVPHSAFISDLITKLPLAADAEVWAKAAITPICNIDNWGDIDSYDLNKEIIKLEKMYK